MIEVLLSCMHQKDTAILERSNLLNEHTLVINQCDKESETTECVNKLHRLISTPTRGLSVSRNMAIENAYGDICIVSDDDEIFFDNLTDIVEREYFENPEADVIIFNLENRHQKLGSKKRWLRKIDLLRVASWQITFKTESVKNKIKFDIKLGAGTGNGGGEENKFLFDCYDLGLRILYVPVSIANGIEDASSTWFFGYDEQYFRKLGSVIRYLLGTPIGFTYCVYTIATKAKLYKKDISMIQAMRYILLGFYKDRLE